MAADIATLAADDFNGRYTLSPDLRRAAELLVSATRRARALADRRRLHGRLPAAHRRARLRARDAGDLKPAAKSGAAARRLALASGEFAVLPQSGSGRGARRAGVAGYAAQSERREPADAAEPGAAS
jgi:hypothetical protein